MPGGRAAARSRLVLVEGDGRITAWSEDRRLYVRLYPPSLDGRRVAIGVMNDRDMEEIWVADLQRHELSRTLTSTTARFNFPCLSPDGSLIVYRLESADARNGVYLQRTDGTGVAVRLLSSPPDGSIRYYPIGWSADGATVYLDKWIGSRAGLACLRVAAPRDTAVRDLFRREDSQAMNGRPSPDGRWLGFQWDQTGRENGYVAALLPDGSLGEPRRLTQTDGGSPEWSGDGHTVYWGGAQGYVTAPFDPSSGQVTGLPRVVLDSQSKLDAEVLPDGRLFAVQGSEEETGSVRELNVVLGWTHELARKMGGAGK